MIKFKWISSNSIKEVEKLILEWIWIRRYRIPLAILAVLVLVAFSNAPYVNLFFNSYLIIFVSAILASFILDISDGLLFKAVMVFLIVAIILWFHDRDSAETITNYIFIILFSAVLKVLFSSGKI